MYRFSAGAFRVLDFYFLVVAKAFLVVYSVDVLNGVVLMVFVLPYWALASYQLQQVVGWLHVVDSW